MASTATVPAAAGRTLLAGITLTTLSVLLPYLLGTLADGVQATLGFGDRGLGYAVAGFWVVSACSAPRLGDVVDRVGWRTAGALGAVAAGVGLVLVGVGGHLLPVLIVGLLVGGLAHGLASPSSHVGVNAAFPPERRGTIFGVKQSAPPAATALAGLAVPAVALAWGWQRAVLVAAVLAPVAAILVMRSGRGPVVHRQQQAGGPAAVTAAQPPGSGQLLRLSLAGGMAATGLGAITAFAPRTMVEAGIAPGAAGIAVTVASAAAIGVKIGAGRWLDRHANGAFAVTGALLVVGAAGMATMATGAGILVVVGAVVGFAGVFGWDGVFLAGVIRTYASQPGWATGRLQLPMAGGTAVGPIAFGLLASTAGYTATWLGFAAVALGGGLAATSAHRHVQITDSP